MSNYQLDHLEHTTLSNIHSLDFIIPFPITSRNFSVSSVKIQPTDDCYNDSFSENVEQICSEDARMLAQMMGLTHNQDQTDLEQATSTVYNPPQIVKQPRSHKIRKRRPKPKKKHSLLEYTKNVLRNMGKAQNQFILTSTKAKSLLKSRFKQREIEQFMEWVKGLVLQNFAQFSQIWSEQGEFGQIYKQLCWMFYSQQGIAYIFHSRMKDQQTKMTHLKYLYRFLEGLLQPKGFKYFKKS